MVTLGLEYPHVYRHCQEVTLCKVCPPAPLFSVSVDTPIHRQDLVFGHRDGSLLLRSLQHCDQVLTMLVGFKKEYFQFTG